VTRLTKRRLEAIAEALASRLAGERDNDNDPEAPTDDDYENAFSWALQELRKREATQ